MALDRRPYDQNARPLLSPEIFATRIAARVRTRANGLNPSPDRYKETLS